MSESIGENLKFDENTNSLSGINRRYLSGTSIINIGSGSTIITIEDEGNFIITVTPIYSKMWDYYYDNDTNLNLSVPILAVSEFKDKQFTVYSINSMNCKFNWIAVSN